LKLAGCVLKACPSLKPLFSADWHLVEGYFKVHVLLLPTLNDRDTGIRVVKSTDAHPRRPSKAVFTAAPYKN